MADQPFWGNRLFQLGVGPKPIPRCELTAERLAHALRLAVSDEAMRDRASALGEQVRAEDGVARAVEAFHRFLPRLLRRARYRLTRRVESKRAA
jgi:sterol 3beta-glucosyltransferase